MIHLLCIQDSERRCRKRREAALGSNSAATREMTRWRERERESVRAPVRTCLHFITSYEHTRPNRIRRSAGIDILFACIYSSDARPIIPVYCETLSLFAPWLRIYIAKCVARISRKILESIVTSWMSPLFMFFRFFPFNVYQIKIQKHLRQDGITQRVF